MPALAKEGGSSGLRRQFNEEQKDIRKENREEIASQSQQFHLNIQDLRKKNQEELASRSAQFRAEMKEKRDEKQRAKLTKFWTQTSNRLSKLIDRESALADKVDARLVKLHDAGKDTASASALLLIARSKITVAQTTLASASAQVAPIIASSSSPAVGQRINSLHKAVLKAIRDAHRAIVAVVNSLHSLSTVATPTPTPTPSSTPTPTPTPSATP